MISDLVPLDPPVPLDASTRRRMQTARRRDTAPELALRRELHRRGRRFFVDRAPLPRLRRRADLVFPRRQVAVFVDGCFWHCCPVHGTRPANNAAWWAAKLDGNVIRDRDTDLRLGKAGWTVVRIWEHEVPSEAADRVECLLAGPSGSTSPSAGSFPE